MKTHGLYNKNCSYLSFISLPVIILLTGFCQLSAQDRTEKYFLGIELKGTLCGYAEVYVTPSRAEGTACLNLDQKTFISFRALGKDISQKHVFSYRIDPATGNFFYHESYMDQGGTQMAANMTVKGDSLLIEPENGEVTRVYLPKNTLLPNTAYFPHLQKDFGKRGLDSTCYPVLNVRTGRVEEVVYHRLGDERIETNDTVYEAVIVREKDPGTGLLTTSWIDKHSGMRLKMESQTGIRMYLTDLSVMEKLSMGNADDLIFIRTNEQIGDLHKINSMKVEVDLDAFPVSEKQALTVPGQSFLGSVAGNSVKGLFEMEYPRYSGEGALQFGKTHPFAEEVSRYLLNEELIQSEATEIRELAIKLTEGSKDFWEATRRLSTWVSANISGSVSGGSALETLQRGDGSCGAQSMLLAALCRASGIPARVVWGCVYTPEYGGSFGHHGWNEAYMGEAGWIPMDVTMHEPDFLDSGHIRLGVLETKATVINFRDMKILHYAIH